MKKIKNWTKNLTKIHVLDVEYILVVFTAGNNNIFSYKLDNTIIGRKGDSSIMQKPSEIKKISGDNYQIMSRDKQFGL